MSDYVISIKRVKDREGNNLSKRKQYSEFLTSNNKYFGYQEYYFDTFNFIDSTVIFHSVEEAEKCFNEIKKNMLSFINNNDYDLSTLAVRKIVLKNCLYLNL